MPPFGACLNARYIDGVILIDRHIPNASGHTAFAKPYDGTGDSGVPGMTYTGGYDVRADADLDGAVANSDKSALSGSKFTLGRGFMSRDATFNRKGYAGYENDGVLGDGAIAKSNTRFWHVRHRVLDSTLGRWTRRDPLSHADMSSLYVYVGGFPIAQVDHIGRCPDCNNTAPGISVRAPARRNPWDIDTPPGWQAPKHRDIFRCQDLRPKRPARHKSRSNGYGYADRDMVPKDPLGIVIFRGPCCDIHDTDYDMCNVQRQPRAVHDERFGDSVLDNRNSSEGKPHLRWLCHILAAVYCNAVRQLGGTFHCDTPNEACACYDGPARYTNPECSQVVSGQ